MPEGGRDQFDLERLERLFQLMEQFDVSEVNLREGETQWRLRRGRGPVVVSEPTALPEAPPAVTPNVTTAAPTPVAPQKTEQGLFIKSPTVGTFYSAPSPDDPPFVKIGDQVNNETVVCLVEAMKVFNQIPAEVTGTIAEILVQNGDAVEFGQPLFRVNPG